MSDWVLDIRGCSFPDQVARTLQAAGRLAPGERLLRVNTRTQWPMIAELETTGRTYYIETAGPQLVRILIWPRAKEVDGDRRRMGPPPPDVSADSEAVLRPA